MKQAVSQIKHISKDTALANFFFFFLSVQTTWKRRKPASAGLRMGELSTLLT